MIHRLHRKRIKYTKRNRAQDLSAAMGSSDETHGEAIFRAVKFNADLPSTEKPLPQACVLLALVVKTHLMNCAIRVKSMAPDETTATSVTTSFAKNAGSNR